MDKPHLTPEMDADCKKTGVFAEQVWACRRDGAKLDDVIDTVIGLKTNNTSILEELVRELYALPFNTKKNIYNIGYAKLYDMLDFTLVDEGVIVPANAATAPTAIVRGGDGMNRHERRTQKALMRGIKKKVLKNAKK